MELRQALAKAGQILDEERYAPSVAYEIDERFVPDGVSRPEFAALLALTAPQQLQKSRAIRPRSIDEKPRKWAFKSGNYDLLRVLNAQITASARQAFASGLLERVAQPSVCSSGVTRYPGWCDLKSELPLVAEFCARNGATEQLLKAIAEAGMTPGVVIMLRQIEEMIALNFTIITEGQYSSVAVSVLTLAKASEPMPNDFGTFQKWSGKSISIRGLFHELTRSVNGIVEECRKAKYLYLKHSLLEGLNTEINEDKNQVQSRLKVMGFSEPLSGSLDEAERLYLDGGSAFDLKASMGHLRSFLEGLHIEAFPAICSKFGGDIPLKWGVGLVCLRNNGILSVVEERFAASLYTIISDEAVHPILAERQYARLFRNVVIEYALLFLWKLEALGVNR